MGRTDKGAQARAQVVRRRSGESTDGAQDPQRLDAADLHRPDHGGDDEAGRCEVVDRPIVGQRVGCVRS